MKLSFSTLSFDEFSFEELIRICKDYGFGGIEIRMGTGIGHTGYTAEELANYRKMLDNAGVVITDLGSGVDLFGNSDEQMTQFVGLLPMAKALGANGIRIFMGTFRRYSYQPLTPIDFDGCVAWLQNACDTAKEYGVCVYIETHNEFATGKELRRLLDAVRRDNCKIIWDIMHPLEDKETPQQTMDYLGSSIAHIHVKDGTTDPDPQGLSYVYGPVGKGEMPIAQIAEILEANGFDGYYSLEWEEPWRESLKELALPHEPVLRDYAEFMREIEHSLE